MLIAPKLLTVRNSNLACILLVTVPTMGRGQFQVKPQICGSYITLVSREPLIHIARIARRIDVFHNVSSPPRLRQGRSCSRCRHNIFIPKVFPLTVVWGTHLRCPWCHEVYSPSRASTAVVPWTAGRVTSSSSEVTRISAYTLYF